MKKNLKKLFAILMTVAVVLSMAMPALAEGNNLGDNAGGPTTAPIGENAPTKGKLTISGTGNYTAYKVFSAVVGEGNDTYTWEPVGGWTLKDKKAIPTPDEIAGYNAEAMKGLADDLENATEKPSGTSVTGSTVAELDLGYYLVVDNGGEGLTKSQPILVAIPQVPTGTNAWAYEISVTPKASSTKFEKKIHEDNKLKDTNTANVGDDIEYYLSADIPEYESSVYDASVELPFSITDKMSKELTWTEDSKIEVYTVENRESVVDAKKGTLIIQDGNYTIDPTVETNTEGGTFTVKFTKSFLKEHRGDVVVVIFSAQLNSKAIIGAATGDNKIEGYDELTGNTTDTNYNGKGNPNAATLQYSNSYYGGKDTAEIDDDVTTFTFEIDVKKLEKGSANLLGNAQFTVYSDPDCKTVYTNDEFEGVLTTGSEGDELGKAVAKGVKNGTYYLKETKAPAGYKVYDGVITVEVEQTKDGEGAFTYTITTSKVTNAETGETETEQETGQTEVSVEDEKGTTLPGTGGIGTTIFTFGGLALIVLAGILLVVYTRKQKKA